MKRPHLPISMPKSGHRRIVIAGLLAVGLIASLSTFAAGQEVRSRDYLRIKLPKAASEVTIKKSFLTQVRYKPKAGRKDWITKVYIDDQLVDNRVRHNKAASGEKAVVYKFKYGRHPVTKKASAHFNYNLLKPGEHTMRVVVCNGTQPRDCSGNDKIKEVTRKFKISDVSSLTTSQERKVIKVLAPRPGQKVTAKKRDKPTDQLGEGPLPVDPSDEAVGEPTGDDNSVEPPVDENPGETVEDGDEPLGDDIAGLVNRDFTVPGLIETVQAHNVRDAKHSNISIRTKIDDGRTLGGVNVSLSPGCDNSNRGQTHTNPTEHGRITFHNCPSNAPARNERFYNYTATAATETSDRNGVKYRVVDGSKRFRLNAGQGTEVVEFKYRRLPSNPNPNPGGGSGGSGGGTTPGGTKKSYRDKNGPLLSLTALSRGKAFIDVFEFAYDGPRRHNVGKVSKVTATVDGRVTDQHAPPATATVRREALNLGNISDGRRHTVTLSASTAPFAGVGETSSSITFIVIPECPAGTTSNGESCTPNGTTPTEPTDPTDPTGSPEPPTPPPGSPTPTLPNPHPDPAGTLQVISYVDKNGNKTEDSGEPRLPNVDFEASCTNTTSGTELYGPFSTDGNGEHKEQLKAPGACTVNEKEVPSLYAATTPISQTVTVGVTQTGTVKFGHRQVEDQDQPNPSPAPDPDDTPGTTPGTNPETNPTNNAGTNSGKKAASDSNAPAGGDGDAEPGNAATDVLSKFGDLPETGQAGLLVFIAIAVLSGGYYGARYAKNIRRK